MKILKKIFLTTVASIDFIALGTTVIEADEFISGANISILDKVERSGTVYKGSGTQRDPLVTLKENGVNYVRLRLWAGPYDVNGNAYGAGANNLNRTLKLVKRIKDRSLKVLPDFHYSDFWVDPGKQNFPKTWQNQSFEQLNLTVYFCTVDVLNQMRSQGVYPDMVQIENESDSDTLRPYRRGWSGDGQELTHLATLLKSGVQIARDTQASNTPIVLHLADGGDKSASQWWLGEVTNQSVDFDIVGAFYYPYWHGTLTKLSENVDNVSEYYSKRVVVVEAAYANILDNADQKTNAFTATEETVGGYKASQDGQYEFLADPIGKIKDIKNNSGLGSFYWELPWYNGSISWTTQAGVSHPGVSDMTGNKWKNRAVFDFSGNTLRAVRAFNYANLTNVVANDSSGWDGYTETPSSRDKWTNS